MALTGFKEPESEVRIPDLEGSSKNLSPRSEDPGLTCRGFVKELEVRDEDPGLRGFVKELESEMRAADRNCFFEEASDKPESHHLPTVTLQRPNIEKFGVIAGFKSLHASWICLQRT